MTDAEYILYLQNRKATLEATNAGIALQIEELEAQETANDAAIANIESLLAYISAGYPAIAQLATPGNFTATPTAAAGVYTVELDWDAVVDATGYKLYRALLSDFSDEEEIYSGATTDYTDNDTDLTYNRQYYYRVKATAAGKADSEYAEVTAEVFEQLATPQNLVLTPGDTIMGVEWDEGPFAITYDLYRHTANDLSAATLIGDDISVTTYNDSGLTNGVPLYYWVIAKSPSRLNSDPATDTAEPAP